MVVAREADGGASGFSSSGRSPSLFCLAMAAAAILPRSASCLEPRRTPLVGTLIERRGLAEEEVEPTEERLLSRGPSSNPLRDFFLP